MLLAAFACGQTAPPVFQVPAKCTFEQVQKLFLPCSVEEPCPLYLEISDVEAVVNRLVVAGNIHTPAATLESVLLVSDDGGGSWTDAHARIPGAAVTDIQFFDFERGWISGHMLQPDARDPFFLITSDGGRNWRRRPVYSEPKIGLIEQFRFQSASTGVMSIDRGTSGESGLRYELWETQTAGDSWSIRQVDNRPIPFPAGPRTGKSLRIRADAPSRTYRVERQENGQWRPLAAFPLNLDPCKPEMPAVEEPAPLPQPEPQSAPETPAPSPKSKPSLKGAG